MLSLNDREWKEFRIEDMFSVKRPMARNKDDYEDGSICFVASGSVNNGVMKCCSPKVGEKMDDGNCLTVSPVDGSCFYQPHSFLGRGGAGSSVLMLYPVGWKRNRYIGEFISRTVNMTASKYSYGHMANSESIKRDRIMLPINNNGEPDFEFMEAYVKEHEQQKMQSYLNYCNEQLEELGSLVSIDEIEDKDWKEFFVSDIFDIPKRGKRIISENYVDGNMAVVSSAGGNNGVIAFAGNTEMVRIYRDCLSVANGGVSAGFAFYHPYDFIATDHVTHFKGEGLNKYHYLFLATIIKNQMHKKYDFSREMTDPRLQREKVIVPIASDGKPDYAYMEQYAKNLMIRKYQQYMDYLKITHNITLESI